MEDFALILTRYALERLLYRLSLSAHRDRADPRGVRCSFHRWTDHRRIVRLATLTCWASASHRRTGAGEMLRDICTIPDAGDGLTFALDSLAAEAIKEDDIYHGVRIRLTANLAQARIPIQIDIGFGDFISPAPQRSTIPLSSKCPLRGFAPIPWSRSLLRRSRQWSPLASQQPDEGLLRRVVLSHIHV